MFDVRVLTFDSGAPDPVVGLMRTFKIERAMAEEIVHGLPCIVKRGVPLETAERFSLVLGNLGARTEVLSAGGRIVVAGARSAFAAGTPAHSIDADGAARYVLPRPNPVALGSVLARQADNGNAERPSQTLAAIQLTRVRASSPGLRVTEVNAEPRKRPSQDELEADIDPPRRASSQWSERARSVRPPEPPPTSEPEQNTSIRPSPVASVRSVRPSGRPTSLRPTSSSEPLALREVDPARRARAAQALSQAGGSLAQGAPIVTQVRERRRAGAVVVTASLLTLVMLASLSLITLGMLPVILLGSWVYDVVKRWSLCRSIESSSVRIGNQQLPELHAAVKQCAERLGMKAHPQLYVAFGVRAGVTTTVSGDKVALLLSADTLAEYVDTEQCHVLAFVLAHELATVALGHHGATRGFLSWLWPAVRKLDVLDADALALELMVNRATAHDALVTLVMGARAAELFDRVDLERQAATHANQSRLYAPALAGQSEFLLARIHRMRRGV